MNRPITARLVCAAAAVLTTWSLFSGVVSLAEPDQGGPVQMAHAPTAVTR